MRRLCAVLVAVLSLLATSDVKAGGCRPRARARANVVVQLDTGLTIVPFVATTQVLVIREPAFFYAYSAYAPPPPATAPSGTAATEQVLPAGEADASGSAASASGLVFRTCGRCHTGAAPAGGFDVSDFERLTAAERLHAVSRIVSDDDALRMPRGRTLSPAEIGALVQEFTRQEGRPAEQDNAQP